MPTDRPYVPRLAVLVLLVMAVAGGALAMTAGAADPDNGKVSLDSPLTGWDGTFEPDPPPVLTAAGCAPPGNPLCDTFTLTVDIDPEHWDSHLGGAEVFIQWASEEEDFDLSVYDKDNQLVDSAESGGTTSERIFIEGANREDGPYRVEVSPFSVSDPVYQGGVRVESRQQVDSAPAEPLSNKPCTDGMAGPFPCKGIDLAGFLPIESMGGRPAACGNSEGNCGNLNDIWGWTDPENGKEYALVGRTGATSFVDVSDPRNPIWLGDLPRHGDGPETIFNIWADIKVYKDHAFIVSEEPDSGLQVFDLTKLRDASREEPTDFTEDAHYSYVLDGPGSFVDTDPERLLNVPDNTHNIAINEESGFAYAIGTSTCGGGGPHMVDIRDPKQPKFAGCVSEDGYTHDNQCVNYRQSDPDGADHGDKEICFNSNEDSLTIVDVTDKKNPVQLSRIPYDSSAYTHQGWLTEDRRYFLVDDELDELGQGGKTKTYIFDVRNLDVVTTPDVHNGETPSIDHNQYILGDRSYQANYRSGLRVLDVSQVERGELSEVGFFDVFPAGDEAEFNGAWSNYPYFESGTVVVSGIEQGLFVLRPSAEAAGNTGTGTTPGTGATPDTDTGSDTGAPACAAAASRARPRRVGRAGLGRKRAAVRKSFGSEGTYRRFVDRFCLADGSAMRVGYPSPKSRRRMSRSDRRRTRGKATLVLTSSPRTRLRGVKVGMTRKALLQRIGKKRGVRVGSNVWYARRGSRARHIFKVHRGKVGEVGLADKKLTRNRRAVKRFFRSDR